MGHIIGIIEKAIDGGYGIYSKDIKGLVGYGLSEAEARQNFIENVEEQAEYYNEKNGKYPEWYQKGYTIEYKYDLSGFFLTFPFIDATKLARYIGINPSLMRRYKSGLIAGEKQKDLIQTKINEIIENMARVKF